MDSPSLFEFREVDVDYVTATTVQGYSDSSLDSFGRFIVNQQIERGEKERPFRFSGYRGWAAGSAATGRRRDGAIVRLSGHAAQQHWQQVVSLASNVSRIDVQVTCWSMDGPTMLLRKHRNESLRARRGKGKPVELPFWGDARGLTALAFGSRSSDRYLRAYDKHAESGLDHYQNCLRYEIEFKNRLAWDKAQVLDGSERWQTYIVQWVLEFASVRGLRLPAEFRRTTSADCGLTGIRARPLDQEGTLHRNLQWLRFGVRPTAQKFIAAGRLGEFLEALGIEDHVKLDQPELTFPKTR